MKPKAEDYFHFFKYALPSASMTLIISEERFISQSQKVRIFYKELLDKDKNDQNFKKLGRVYRQLKSLYFRDKVYAVKHLNFLEKMQVAFSEEKRALVVQTVEILQKLILHKKLNKSDQKITRKKRTPEFQKSKK